MTNEKVYKEVYQDLKKKKVTTIPYDKYRDRLQDRNQAAKKQEFIDRRIKTGG